MKSGLKSLGKIALLVVCMALLAISASAVTMAFLTDTDEDINTFVLGDVEITLDEAKVTPNGVPVVENGEQLRTSESNLYQLVPGGSYTKDPTVTVKGGGSEAYVRMVVTVKGLKQIKEVFGDSFDPEKFIEGWEKDIWIYYGTEENAENNTVTYEFRYYKTVEGSETDFKLEPLFTTFVVPKDITTEDVKILAENINISVAGNGIQAAGFENEDEAWESFDIQISG
ncbi:MAG: hypothetical protein IJ306_04055 [Oscillospiraceae bacterium]|nr:hypothetical protein [Oscillospiraceae bacterium]